MNRSIHGGAMRVVNNSYIGEAYSNQLFHQPSLTELARQQRHDSDQHSQCSSSGLMNEEENSSVQFDPMADDDEWTDDVERNHNNTEDDDRDDTESTLPLKYRNKMRRYKEMRDKVPASASSPPEFNYSGANVMGTQATAYAELLKICQKHHADKSLFDDIQKWATHWSQKDEHVFKQQSSANRWSRKKLLKFLKNVFPFEGMEPKTHTVELHDGRIVSVPQVDFANSMLSILNDKEVMKHVMKGLDPNTWRPIISEDEHENDDNAMIDDKDSGWLFRQGIKLHCPGVNECDPTKVRPFPLLMHIDMSHADLFGNLKVAPIQVMPAILDVNVQQTVAAWRQIATIPNLSAGKGKDDKTKSIDKLKDFHKVTAAALSSLVECYESGGFIWRDGNGEEILLKPYIHMFIGDIAGVNEMVGHYNTWKANCLVKDCKCSQDDILQFPLKCKQMTWADLNACSSEQEVFDLYSERGLISERDMTDMMNDPVFAKTISKHPINNAFDALPLADPYQGIIGMTPQEMLHLMGCGIFKYLIHGIRDIIGENQRNARVKALINDIFPDVKLHLKRNAERDLPRMSNRNGFFNITSLTNEEVRGNFLGLVVLMHTSYGEDLLAKYFEAQDIDYHDMLETCCLVLAWERFHLDPQKRSNLIDSHAVTQTLMERIIAHVPRPETESVGKKKGSRGWKISKMHASSFFSLYSPKFGRAKCSDSSCNEKNHRSFVKHNAKLTQRISSKFATQLAQNDYDRVVIERVYDYIRHQCSQSHNDTVSQAVAASEEAHADCFYDSDGEADDDDSDDEVSLPERKAIAVRGKYTMAIHIDTRNRVTVSSKFTYPPMQMLGVQPNQFVHKTIADASIKYCLNRDMDCAANLNIQGFTSAVIGGCRYRSTPYWKGEEWYDWAVVKFPPTVDSAGGDSCICRVMGFFQYMTPGCMTYKNQESVSTPPEELVGCLDDTLYAVLHCQKKYFSYSRLQSQFIRKFKMMDPSGMYILPARCIRCPLLVVPDIESSDTVSLTDYIAVLPRHKMGAYWTYYVQEQITVQEGDDVTTAQDNEDDSLYGDEW